MKPWNTRTVSTMASLIILTMMSVTLGFNCTRMKSEKILQTTGSSHGPGGTPDGTVPEVSAPSMGVAFLSAEQILKSMISSTGTEGLGELTTREDDSIDSTFRERAGSLPSLQNLNQATGPTLIAVTNLASTICAKAVDRERETSDTNASQRLFFREFRFTQGLNGQTSDAVTSAFSRLARNSWRRDPVASELEGITTFAQEFSTGVNTSSSEQTRYLAISVCVAVVSSIDGLTY